MKIREIDKLGRIVIPINFRKSLGITENTVLNIEEENGSIIITPINVLCKLCNQKITNPTDVPLCYNCIRKIKEL